MHWIRPLTAIIAYAGLLAAAVCALLTLGATLIWRARSAAARPPRDPDLRPVSVLKPLCGAEPGLYANLRSYCGLNYPQYQIVFGVRDADDPALAVVRRLMTEFPSQPVDVVIDPQLHGTNRKVSNLINMLARARHDVLIMADSDTCVDPDYLTHVVAPLADPRIGLVTSIYHGVPTPLLWSRLGAMYINEWYIPAVLLAWLFGHQGYASGQTLCLRRATLEAIGGLQAVADHLAEDYRLGELVRERGLAILLSDYLVAAEHHEPDAGSLMAHELRWMRTTRVLRPRSFRWLFFTFTLPLAGLGLLLAAAASAPLGAAWGLFGVALGARLGLHLVHRFGAGDRPLSDLWLVPVRDLLLFWIWCRTFFISHVTWRGEAYDVGLDGVMRPLP